MQAIRTVRRDVCSYVLPSTLLRLLSLGPAVITVDQVFTAVMPFSAGVPLPYKKLLAKIQGEDMLPAAAASVRPLHALAAPRSCSSHRSP